MTRSAWSSAVVVGGTVALAASMAFRPAFQIEPAGSNPVRLMQMQYHFLQVSRIHEAIIRGDLAAVHEPAAQLSQLATPPGIPAAGAPFLASIREAAGRAASATTLNAAATATVQMLVDCSGCHRAVGVRVSPIVATRPDVGGLVGHMLEHQRAADDMLLGLLIPSPSQWQEGAERLSVAALKPAEFPRNASALGKDVDKAEARVHQLAKQAANAHDPNTRAGSYAQIMTVCAQCHVAHSQVWGPGTSIH